MTKKNWQQVAKDGEQCSLNMEGSWEDLAPVWGFNTLTTTTNDLICTVFDIRPYVFTICLWLDLFSLIKLYAMFPMAENNECFFFASYQTNLFNMWSFLDRKLDECLKEKWKCVRFKFYPKCVRYVSTNYYRQPSYIYALVFDMISFFLYPKKFSIM